MTSNHGVNGVDADPGILQLINITRAVFAPTISVINSHWERTSRKQSSWKFAIAKKNKKYGDRKLEDLLLIGDKGTPKMIAT